MIRETLMSQPQQTLQHINPSHQDEPFQSMITKLNFADRLIRYPMNRDNQKCDPLLTNFMLNLNMLDFVF